MWGIKIRSRGAVVGVVRVFHRGRGRIVLLLAVLIAGLIAAPGAAAPRGRLGVGDSIMLSAADELASHGIKVNAEPRRLFAGGLRVMKRLAARGRLPRIVIVHLGTYGPIGGGACDAIVSLAGTSHRIFLVTIRVPRRWRHRNNALLTTCAHKHARVHALYWYAFSSGHPRWFAGDGYHLTPLGQTAYAAFIDAGVRRIIGPTARGGARPVSA